MQRLLTPAAVAALRSVGLAPAAPICSLRVLSVPPIRDAAPRAAGVPRGLPIRVDVIVRARRDLLDELRVQAEQIGAVGVVDIEFGQRPLGFHPPQSTGSTVELIATGVPVTATTHHRPVRCFRTTLDAAGTATLLRAGWVPVDLVVVGTTQVRSPKHRNDDALAATSRTNREIPGPTDMIQRSRRLLREQLAAAARSLGGDGVLLHGGFAVTWSSTYHLVQVDTTGNVIARYGRHPPGGRPRTTVSARA